MDQYTYLLINVLTIAYPLAQSYEHRLRFLSQWKAIAVSMSVGGAVFLAWDEVFTRIGVWGFNERYLTGLKIGALPIEEWGFFVTVPFACLFIYEVLNHFIKRDIIGKNHIYITLFFLVVTLVLGYSFSGRLYTSVCFFFTAMMLALQLIVFRSAWMGRFYLAYFVSLFPFLVMNGWLTGAFTEEPIVWYSDLENMGLRIATIPAEDTMYLLGYLLLIVGVYERVRE